MGLINKTFLLAFVFKISYGKTNVRFQEQTFDFVHIADVSEDELPFVHKL